MPNRATAREHERSSTLDIVSYDLVVELTGGAATFSSRTEIRFRCKRPGSTSFADLQAARVRRAVLNGANVEIGRVCDSGSISAVDLRI
jgi:aminopeptidase N